MLKLDLDIRATQQMSADGIDLDTRLGRSILRLRQYRGLTQQTLAKRCGVTQAAVSQVESGKRINNINTLFRISTGLGVALPDLIRFAIEASLEEEALYKETDAAVRASDREGTIPFEDVKKRLKRK
jgi:transcriptional regulator with XRE-family HTH domain